MAEQSTQKTVSTQDAGTKRSSETRGQKAPVGTDSQEVEWHFDVDYLGRVEGWLGEGLPGSGLVVGPGSAEDLVDGYYDTEDWRLYRAGYALRIRQKGGGAEATMKSLAPSEGGLRRRREISEPLKDAKIGTLRTARGPVAERLRLLVGLREVVQIFEVRNNRKTFALNLADEEGGVAAGAADGAAAGVIVEDASGNLREASGGAGKGTRIGEVVLDSTEIPLGEDETDVARLTRVEVEVAAGQASDPRVRGFVSQMHGSLGLRQARISKYEAGLFATGLSPEGWADLGPPGVDASLSLGELAFAVLRRQFAAMRAHEPGTRMGEDPEELHDMRVATRRMRAAIKIFRDALPERSRWLREELRHFAGVLGEVRDLDVHIEEVKGLSSGDGEEDEALAAVVASLEGRRAEARGRMLESLDSERYARFESSFAEMLRRGPYVAGTPEASPTNGPSGASAAGVPAPEAAPRILGRLYSKWRKAAKRLDQSSHVEEFHNLRKKGKRLRYA
ncbi:MAG TPA: CHAD domain-containing protein, partial [Rubrobacter sp.]|nr:CHAD domain-containing protein [Rubrobacter sp.]